MPETQIEIIPWQARNQDNLDYLREELQRLKAKKWDVRILNRKLRIKQQRRQIKLVRFINE